MKQTTPEAWSSGLLDYGRDSHTSGNRGGAAVFHILRRTHDAGQEPDTRAVLYSAAPGLTATAWKGSGCSASRATRTSAVAARNAGGDA
jgi:germicidin synthase